MSNRRGHGVSGDSPLRAPAAPGMKTKHSVGEERSVSGLRKQARTVPRRYDEDGRQTPESIPTAIPDPTENRGLECQPAGGPDRNSRCFASKFPWGAGTILPGVRLILRSGGLWYSQSFSPHRRGRSIVVMLQPSKLATRVQFPSPAPFFYTFKRLHEIGLKILS